MSEEDVWIGGTDIQIGMHGFINQPKEIIEYIKYLQKEKERLNNKLELISKIVEKEFPPNEFITYKIKKILKEVDKE